MNFFNKGIKLTLAAIAVSSFIVGCGGEEAKKETTAQASAPQKTETAAPAPAAEYESPQPVIITLFKFLYKSSLNKDDNLF